MLDDDRLHGPRFEYSEAAVTEILDFLSSNSAGTVTADGSIDPSQLQIVCQYVERTIVPRKAGAGAGPVRIDAADLEGRAGLDQVLSRFYRRTIESLPGDQAHRAEALCEQGLINREGRRLSLEQGQIVDEYGVTLVTLQALVDGRLLRADPRVGSVYYELAHDTLVPAIRADREARLARRRRRRNRLLAALVALAVLVGLVATAIIASSGSGDGGPSDVVAPPPPPPSLAAGEQDTATLDAATPSREFTVTAAGAAPLEVRVEPDPNLDVVVVATDAAGGTRSQDQLGNGGVERLVIPHGAETDDEYVIQVTSLAPPDAGFTIAVGEIEPDDLAVGEASSGAIAAEGDVAVYSLTLGDGDQAIVDVVPQLEDAAEASGDTEAKATLDPTIELIDPTSDESRSIVDAGGPGVAERAIVSRPGPTLVVVRGKTTTGGFTIEVTDKSPEVPIGRATAGAIDQVGAVSEFSFAAEPGAAHAVLVAPDLQLDGVLGITGGSEPRTVDRVRQGRPELAVVVADGADVDLQVSGFESSVGSFDLTVSPAATQPEPDAAVSGSGLAVYDVPLAEGETKLLSVAPAADTTEIELVWFAPDGAIAGTALSSGDQPASLTIDGAAGPHRVVVVPRSTVEGEAPSGYVVTSTSEQAYIDAFAALLDDIAALEQRTEQYGTDRTALEAELFGGDPVADPGQDFAATLNAYQAGHRELAEQYASDVQPMIAALEAAPLPVSPFGDLDAVRDAAVRHYRSWLDFVDEYQRAIELWTFDVLGGRTTENLVDDARNRMRPFIDETANSFTDLCTALSDEQPPSGSFQGTIAAECES
jgi:hypothetical protein